MQPGMRRSAESVSPEGLMIFTGSANTKLASDVASHLLLGLGNGTNATGGTGTAERAAARQFSGYHTGVVQFARGDGSVGVVRIAGTGTAGADRNVLLQIGGKQDGGTLDTAALIN